MRLIDADDFNKDIIEYFCWKKKVFIPPTEWQEGYWYAIDEFQRNLENRKTIKAIPIAWIEKQLLKCDNIHAELYVNALLEDWEKQYERQV